MPAAAATRLRPALPVVLWHSVRPRSLPIAALSSVVGTLALLPAQRPEPLIAALCLVLAVLLQCATNVLNDAEDSRTGADDFPAAGSSLAMKAGWVDASGARVIALACFLLAALDGAAIVVLVQKPALVLLGAAAVLAGWAYTAWPLRLAYRPLGELASALPMGIGIPWGTAAAQTSSVPAAVWFAAIPLALLTAAILHANNARDRAHDASVGKRTLATYLSPRGVVLEYQALLILGPVLLAFAVAFQRIPVWTAIAIVPGLRAIVVAGRASVDLDARGWTVLLINAVKLHQLTALALCAGFLLSVI
ncbi:MAG: prenyltransferase [Candidatus Dormibacteraeota bacterium]|nr:prenyltransferase [Candidatus Dormibacteraeota bacterium]MBV9526126.1 prenyltransferase [Candidatus Dormibacteraeota bacterium]